MERKVKRICLFCGKELEIRPCDIKKGLGKYCNKKCFGKSEKGKKFTIEHRKNMSENHRTKHGFKSGHYKGGKYKNSQGYIMILIPTHPQANNQGYVREHRIILEKKIGRYLHRWEISHHKNRIKNDNKPENLRLKTLKGENSNAFLHSKERGRNEKGQFISY